MIGIEGNSDSYLPMVCFILCVCWAVIIILSEFQLMTEFSVQAPQYSYSESLWSWLGDIGRRCWNKCWSVKGPMSLSKAMALKFGLTSHLASVFKSWGHKSNCHRKGFYKSLMTLIIEFRFWTLAIGQERSLARSMSVCIWQNTCQMPNAKCSPGWPSRLFASTAIKPVSLGHPEFPVNPKTFRRIWVLSGRQSS